MIGNTIQIKVVVSVISIPTIINQYTTNSTTKIIFLLIVL